MALGFPTGQAPSLNFNKYLEGGQTDRRFVALALAPSELRRDGKTIVHFHSKTAPTGAALVAAVETALAAKP